VTKAEIARHEQFLLLSQCFLLKIPWKLYFFIVKDPVIDHNSLKKKSKCCLLILSIWMSLNFFKFVDKFYNYNCHIFTQSTCMATSSVHDDCQLWRLFQKSASSVGELLLYGLGELYDQLSGKKPFVPPTATFRIR